MPCSLYQLAKHLQIVLAVACGLAFANQPKILAGYFTPQEVLTHFSTNDQIKEAVFIVTNPYTAPDWVLALRSIINRNFWQERVARGVEEVSFEEPLLVRSVIQLDEEVNEEVRPIVEANARVRAEQALEEMKVQITRLKAEKDSLPPETYERRKRELNEWYESGSKEALFERWVEINTASFEKDYSARYLLPTFYKGNLEGFIRVKAEKRYEMEQHMSGFRRPLGYPLSVDAQEAKEIAATKTEPTLVDLGQVVRLGTEEGLFWLMDDRVVGAMTGTLYKVVNTGGKAVDPFQVAPEVRRGGAQPGELEWFYLELPVTLEPVQAARYRWNATRTGSPWALYGLSLFVILISTTSLLLSARQKKRATNKKD